MAGKKNAAGTAWQLKQRAESVALVLVQESATAQDKWILPFLRRYLDEAKTTLAAKTFHQASGERLRLLKWRAGAPYSS